MSTRSMNILTFASLYPNSAQPIHGIFVENRIRHLAASGEVDIRVMAPVPWFPLSFGPFGSYKEYALVPNSERRFDIPVVHPRYPVIPKIGMSIAPFLMYTALKPVLRRFLQEGPGIDLIDAHYFYPDGVAAAMLGRAFNKPVVITARGTDINLIPQYAVPRRQILWAAKKAAGIISVCQALKDEMVELGVSADKIKTLRNGVDLEIFRPRDRSEARRELKLTTRTLLSVGHLIARKGHDIAISALPILPDTALLIAGDGPERQNLEKLARRLGVLDRVIFLGRVSHDQLAKAYTAADALVLASDREGWANVLLEAMACGLPVVATNIWGTPEIVATHAAGVLMEDRTPEALAAAVCRLFENLPDRRATREYAEQFSWDETTAGQLDLFRSILEPKKSFRSNPQ